MIFEDIQIGEEASVDKAFNKEEVKSYARTSIDTNPIHYDTLYASETIFSKPIVQGMLAASLFGGLLGSTLPGPGTILIGQSLRFKNPIYINERITAKIKVKSKIDEKSIIIFDCEITKQNNDLAIIGEQVVMFKGNSCLRKNKP